MLVIVYILVSLVGYTSTNQRASLLLFYVPVCTQINYKLLDQLIIMASFLKKCFLLGNYAQFLNRIFGNIMVLDS